MKSWLRAFWYAYVELFDITGRTTYRRMQREMSDAVRALDQISSTGTHTSPDEAASSS